MRFSNLVRRRTSGNTPLPVINLPTFNRPPASSRVRSNRPQSWQHCGNTGLSSTASRRERGVAQRSIGRTCRAVSEHPSSPTRIGLSDLTVLGICDLTATTTASGAGGGARVLSRRTAGHSRRRRSHGARGAPGLAPAPSQARLASCPAHRRKTSGALLLGLRVSCARGPDIAS